MAGAMVLALTFTAAAQYETPSPQAAPSTDMTRSVMGTVVSVSDNSLVVKTESGDQMIFTRDASSVIPIMVSAGSAVRVDYETPQPGVFHVSTVIMDTGASDRTSQQEATGSTTPQATGTEMETMPKTASPLPLVGLLGLMALGGAVALHSLHRR
jgi:hypothetical protein